METREIIEDAIDYAVTEFIGQMYFEDLGLEAFKQALVDGVITVDEIVHQFRIELESHL